MVGFRGRRIQLILQTVYSRVNEESAVLTYFFYFLYPRVIIIITRFVGTYKIKTIKKTFSIVCARNNFSFFFSSGESMYKFRKSGEIHRFHGGDYFVFHQVILNFP